MLLAFAPALARAEEPSVEGLTLDEAIGRALAHSLSLRLANLEVEKKEALREQAAEAVTFTPVQRASYDPSFEVKWYGLLSADLQWQMSKKSYASAEDALVLQTCQKYWGVQAAQEQVQVARLALECAEVAARNARAMARVGAIAKTDLEGAEARLEQTRRTLAAAEATLAGAYQEFNRLVGLAPEDRPLLVDTPKYRPVEVASIEHEIARVLEASPAVWQAEQGRTLAEWNLWMAYAGGSYQPYEARRTEVEKAQVSAAEARQATEQVVRSLYSSLRALEERYAAQEQQVAEKQEKLRVTQAKFAVGMVTRADVKAAELELAQARAALDDLVRQHAYLKLAFQKPWAAAGGGSSLSGTGSGSGSNQ
ncbi:MAG: TolC family protein [Clostridia bacterium]|nr:TolC family protein [Clostridia bacterium]